MYKSIFIAFLVLIVSHFFATKAESAELTGQYDMLTGWTKGGPYRGYYSGGGPVDSTAWEYLGASLYDGTNTLETTATGLTVGNEYTVTWWMQLSGTADSMVRMKVDGVVLAELENFTPGTSWTQVSAVFTAGATSQTLYWQVWTTGSAGVSHYSIAEGDTILGCNFNNYCLAPAPETITTTGTSGGISGSQSTEITSARTRASTYNSNSDNSVYIDQAGNNNTVTITQQGTAGNHIRGIDGASAGVITGDSNTIEIMQGSPNTTDPNLIELSVVGSTNDILLYQDRVNGTGAIDTVATGGHTISLDLFGNLNDIDVVQRNNTVNQGHYVGIDLIGDSNVIDVFQANDYSKKLFSTVTGNSNLINVIQKGDSSKYAEIELIGNGHSVDLTQQGLGNHDASISLTYGSASSSVTLDQNSSLDQSYSLEQTCYTIGGCSATVTQN